MENTSFEFKKNLPDWMYSALITKSGQGLIDENVIKKIWSEEDGDCLPKPGFWVLFTSRFEIEDLEEFLGNQLYLEKFEPVCVK